MFKSAYLKLTLFYVLIAMTVSIVFSVVHYQVSSSEINTGLGRQTRFLRELPTGNQLPTSIQQLEKMRLDQMETSHNRLTLNLIYINILVLILSTIVGYFLARKTLGPIEKMMEVQSRFTADASHELRTPLAAMKAEIEVALRNQNLNLLESKKLLKSNLEEIAKLEELSTALLKLARLDGNASKNFEKILIDEIIISGFEKVEKLADKKQIEFKNELVRMSVLGDRQSLIELFVILFENAIKYSPAKSKIEILMKKTDGHHIVIKIKDHGIGIKASDLPCIFNRFYRADLSRSKEKIDGYGLGLSIAKQIVELHHGQIEVESKLSHGTTFIVKLPVLK